MEQGLKIIYNHLHLPLRYYTSKDQYLILEPNRRNQYLLANGRTPVGTTDMDSVL